MVYPDNNLLQSLALNVKSEFSQITHSYVVIIVNQKKPVLPPV